MINEIKNILLKIINLRDTTDVKGTIDSIRSSIAIRGYNVWILACGAMLASIGITQDSTAVIIGAMLISPLMSPILGIGLSIGINDKENLLLALENFAIAVLASLLVSTLYFWIIPFDQINDQISSRIEPTVLDVLIAVFGGVAGIVAGSRKEKTNAIPGVAIATALMPPICVAGFGLANQQWQIFIGAFYLFFINAVCIATATYLIVRFLRFPYKSFLDEAARKKATRLILGFVFLIILPSGIFMYNFTKRFNNRLNVESFIQQEIYGGQKEENYTGNHYVTQYYFNPAVGDDSLNTLNLLISGPALLPDTIKAMESRLGNYHMENTRLHVIQSFAQANEREIRSKATLEALSQIQPNIDQLHQRIDTLSSQLTAVRADTIPLSSLQKEIPALFPQLAQVGFSESIIFQFQGKPDTLPTMILKWKPGYSNRFKQNQEVRIKSWIIQRMSLDTLKIVWDR